MNMCLRKQNYGTSEHADNVQPQCYVRSPQKKTNKVEEK